MASPGSLVEVSIRDHNGNCSYGSGDQKEKTINILHIKKALIALGLLVSVSATAQDLKPFTTDGCSLFPDGTNAENSKWMECCIRHDFSYWKGGTELEREQADQELQQCVADLGKEKISKLMHLGVRFGGSPYFPTWYRWGYGWEYMRGYEPLTEDEKTQIRGQLEVLHNLIGEFIEQTD